MKKMITNNTQERQMTRRQMVGSALATAGVITCAPTFLRALNLHNKLNIAMIACGGRALANMNGDGGAGIELQNDRELQGTPGQVSFNVDARRRVFRGKVERAPVQGQSFVLSLDRSIQYVAERELAAALEKTLSQRPGG